MSRAKVLLRNLSASEIHDAEFRCKHSQNIPNLVLWEIFEWDDVEIVEILSTLNLSEQPRCKTFLVSLKELSGIQVPAYCPIHGSSQKETCSNLSFAEQYLLYLLWYQTPMFRSIKKISKRDAWFHERCRIEMMLLLESKVLPFLSSSIRNISNSFCHHDSPFWHWLRLQYQIDIKVTFGRFLGAVSPCMSKLTCSRIERVFRPINHERLSQLAILSLSKDTISIFNSAVQGLPIVAVKLHGTDIHKKVFRYEEQPDTEKDLASKSKLPTISESNIVRTTEKKTRWSLNENEIRILMKCYRVRSEILKSAIHSHKS
jgi:hypothetical protein